VHHRSSIFHSAFEEPISSENARALILALRSASGSRRIQENPKRNRYPMVSVALAGDWSVEAKRSKRHASALAADAD
jgi:hypothetical protein